MYIIIGKNVGGEVEYSAESSVLITLYAPLP